MLVSSKKVSVQEVSVDYREPCLSGRSWVMVVSALVAATVCRVAGSPERHIGTCIVNILAKGVNPTSTMRILGISTDIYYCI